MKRQSIAEQTLNKQIKLLQGREAEIETTISELRAQQQALFLTRQSMEKEVYRLHQAREAASEKAKP